MHPGPLEKNARGEIYPGRPKGEGREAPVDRVNLPVYHQHPGNVNPGAHKKRGMHRTGAPVEASIPA